MDIAAEVVVELTEDIPQQRAASKLVYPIGSANSSNYKPALIKAIDAVKFTAMFVKHHYDKKHKPMFFKVGDYVSL